MSLEGFIEYKRREFCNDVKCSVQMELNKQTEKAEVYEQIRQKCSTACVFTTWQFHHWLIEKGYLILKPIKEKAWNTFSRSMRKMITREHSSYRCINISENSFGVDILLSNLDPFLVLSYNVALDLAKLGMEGRKGLLWRRTQPCHRPIEIN